MRILLPVIGIFHLFLCLALGQGMQSYKDRDEELALQKARALKEMKRAIDGPSSPGPVRIIAGGYQSGGYNSPIPRPGEGGARYEAMKREPLRLSVMTPQGLVPLSTFQDPNWQSAQAAEAAKREEEANQGIGRRLESQIKAWRISLFDRDGKPTGIAPESAQTAALPGQQGSNPQAEVIAIVEETPSQTEGGQPERRILGFLPSNRTGSIGEPKPVVYRGLQAKTRNAPPSPAPAAPASATVGRDAKPEKLASSAGESASRAVKETPSVGREVKTRKAAAPGEEVAQGEEAFTEEDVIAPSVSDSQRKTLNRWFQRKGGEDLVATGEEVVLNPASPDRQRSFLDNWFDRSRGVVVPEHEVKTVRPAAAPTPAKAADYTAIDGAEYLATTGSHSPFHVIDSGPGETYVVELPQGTVGRAHGSGDQWAWMQLDTGLMGLMRKQHLRPAKDLEIEGYLAAERSASESGSLASKRSREGGAVSVEPGGAEPGMAEEPSPVGAGDAPVPAGLMTPDAEKKPRPVVSPPQEGVLKSLE